MAYTCFISYNTRVDERVVVYRLQTLAGASGIEVLLPERRGKKLSEETKHRIRRADSVLAFLTSSLSPAVREELAYAEGLGKLIIPIHEKGARVTASRGLNWIEYDPRRDTPGDVEDKVLRLLKTKAKERADQQAMILAVLGIGLLALASSKSR